jgi:hypothetical protein
VEDEQEPASPDEAAAKARRRAAIAEAFTAVTEGPRIPISEHMTVPLRLLGTVQQARDERRPPRA